MSIPEVFSQNAEKKTPTQIVLLLLANLTTDASTLAWTAFGVLAAGFIGGGLLFRFIFKDRLPMKFVGMHASVGLLGLLLLYLTAF